MQKYLSRSTSASTADSSDVEPGKKKFFRRLRMLELVLRLPGTSKGPALLLERLLFKYLQDGKEDGRVVEHCFPSDPTLINDTKMRAHELKRCMAQLRKVGLIDWRWVGSKRFISFNWSVLEKKPGAVATKTDEEQGPEKPKKVRCPHCKKTGSTNAMRRWHFDRCRERPIGDGMDNVVPFKHRVTEVALDVRLDALAARSVEEEAVEMFKVMAQGRGAVNKHLEEARRNAETPEVAEDPVPTPVPEAARERRIFANDADHALWAKQLQVH
jgi:hypothetical protein